MEVIENIFIKNLPTIDLHGFDREMARVSTDDFVSENVSLGNEKIVIIHGRGQGIVKKSVHEALKKNKKVRSFMIDGFNVGCTIVELMLDGK